MEEGNMEYREEGTEEGGMEDMGVDNREGSTTFYLHYIKKMDSKYYVGHPE